MQVAQVLDYGCRAQALALLGNKSPPSRGHEDIKPFGGRAVEKEAVGHGGPGFRGNKNFRI